MQLGGASRYFCPRVARFALGLRMRARQREIGLRVVEAPGVEGGDLHVTPLVIGVTAAAGLDLDAAVIARLRAHVGRHRLVAVEAEAVLRGAC